MVESRDCKKSINWIGGDAAMKSTMKCERDGIQVAQKLAIEIGVKGISAGRVDAVIDAIDRVAEWVIAPGGWWTEETAISVESEAVLRVDETWPEFATREAA